MCEAIYRERQAVKRLFGASAVLAGSIGSARGPGHVAIVLDGRQIGTGRTFQAALQDVTTRTSSIQGRATR